MLCNRLPNFSWLLGYNTLQTCHKHHSFSENVQGDRKPLCSFNNSLLSNISQLTAYMLILLCLSPFVKERSHLQEKFMYHILQTNKHLHTAGHHYKQENLTLYGKEAYQPSSHMIWKVHMWRAFWVFNHQNPLCISNRKQNFTFPFPYKLANGQTTSLSSHLLDCLVHDLSYGPWPVTVDS
jgi:hypothetical protein